MQLLDRIEIWDVPPGWPIKMILAWSLPLPVFVLLVGEWRLRRRRPWRRLCSNFGCERRNRF